jgi:hypothetical protein
MKTKLGRGEKPAEMNNRLGYWGKNIPSNRIEKVRRWRGTGVSVNVVAQQAINMIDLLKLEQFISHIAAGEKTNVLTGGKGSKIAAMIVLLMIVGKAAADAPHYEYPHQLSNNFNGGLLIDGDRSLSLVNEKKLGLENTAAIVSTGSRAENYNPLLKTHKTLILDKDVTDDITVLVLRGSHYEMGMEYGKQMADKLRAVLDILKRYYVNDHGVPYSRLVEKAGKFYARYSFNYQPFIDGMARGSGLSLDDCKVLNGMETLSSLITESYMAECAFMFIPPSRTQMNSAIIGRNYDFFPPFGACAKYLTVTVLQEPNKTPTAFVSMPGQIYCPSCINSRSMFVELNNGEPSGGFTVDHERQSLLIDLLEIIQNAGDFSQIERQLRATESDYSLIINTADAQSARSFEFSSINGMKPNFPNKNDVFVSTNFFLNTTWPNLPMPTDNTTWFGVTRRNNLLSLASKESKHNASTIQSIMEKRIEDGGAVWAYTIYQLIFDTSDSSLYLRATQHQSGWTHILLQKFLDAPEPVPFDDTFLKMLLSGAGGSIITGSFSALFFGIILVINKHKKAKKPTWSSGIEEASSLLVNEKNGRRTPSQIV